MRKYGSPEKIQVLKKESNIINRFLHKFGKKSYSDLEEEEKAELKKEIESDV